jgi:hypothetical protein
MLPGDAEQMSNLGLAAPVAGITSSRSNAPE